MSIMTCQRCGTEFDTERPPVTPQQNTERCGSCGYDHSKSSKDAKPANPVEVVDRPTPTDVLPVEKLAESDGDLHLHIHYHGTDE